MKMLKLLGVALAVLVVLAAPALAQPEPKQPAGTAVSTVPSTSVFSGRSVGAGLGMALTIIGAGYGLGRIGSSALESMARQPEVAPRIQTAMIIIAAMLEGATLASVILCYLVGTQPGF